MLVVDRLELASPEPRDLVVARMTFAPGGAASWELPHSPALVVVERGSLTWYSVGECDARTFTSGHAFVRADPSDGLIRNEGSIEAAAIVTFVALRSLQGGVECTSID